MIYLDIRAHRTRRRMTLLDLASEAGVEVSTISRIERRKTKGVDFDVLEKLAKALRVKPGALVRVKRSTTKGKGGKR